MAQDSRQSDEPEQEPKRGDDHRSSTTERGLVGSLLPSTNSAGHRHKEAEAAPIPAQFEEDSTKELRKKQTFALTICFCFLFALRHLHHHVPCLRGRHPAPRGGAAVVSRVMDLRAMQDDEVVVVPDDAGVQSAWPAWKHLLEDLADARPPPRSVLARRALRFCVGHVTRTRPQIRPRPF